MAIPYDDLMALGNNTKAEIDKIFQDKLVIKVKIKKNKAVYSAALVADWWAGGENLKKEFFVTDQQTDRPTDGLTNRRIELKDERK